MEKVGLVLAALGMLAVTARIRATNGTSEYGSNNVFGSTSGILLNRN